MRRDISATGSSSTHKIVFRKTYFQVFIKKNQTVAYEIFGKCNVSGRMRLEHALPTRCHDRGFRSLRASKEKLVLEQRTTEGIRDERYRSSRSSRSGEGSRTFP